MICQPLSAKFGNGGTIALFELTITEDAVRIVRERHYDLVPENSTSEDELRDCNARPDD